MRTMRAQCKGTVVNETMLVETAGFLCVLSFIVGAIAGYAMGRNKGSYDFNDDPPRSSLARDVYTPGSKLVAIPHVKPSSAWPRTPAQRAQSQVEHGDVA